MKRLRLAAVVGSGGLLAGLGSYVMLVVAARGLSAEDYGAFSTYWSVVILLGLGVYLPVEQETARRIASVPPRPGRPGLLRSVAIVSAALTAAVLLVLGALVAGGAAGDWMPVALVAATAVTALVYAILFPVRGVVAGRHRSEVYSAVFAAEGLLRIVLPLALLAVGAPLVGYAFVVPVVLLVSMLPALGELRSVRRQALPDAPVRVFAAATLRIVVAALAIQAVLNSPVLLVGAVGADQALAGRVLAVLTIARIPLLVYQAFQQSVYLPRLARAKAQGGAPLRVVGAVAAAGLGVGVVVVGCFWLLGDWAVALLFGPDLVLGGPAQLVIAGGASLFLVAQILSDAGVALGRHNALVAVWVPSMLVGFACALLPLEPGLRVALPLLVASGIAAVAFAVVLRRAARAAA